ncbi:hypothetical protein F511_24107 [Dorcoceras hygrometricum]|uniref:XS domain-containing protein n=1 Tax=Dorcoceras hygrometricum TaxID=472368 RepID=A0A2Z7A6H0_9LAMI|nr:hypothetical protein F511_24107 [Dorcoceras hygrometricum]
MHSLIMHAYNLDTAESIVDHLAFHKALCVLMGWNYLIPPDHSKAYQKLSSDDAEANQDDLIMWPPSVLIHNTVTGKGRDGRLEGLGNKVMDSILRASTRFLFPHEPLMNLPIQFESSCLLHAFT